MPIKCIIPFPVNNSIMSVNKKPNIANLPFQFSAEDVNPQTQDEIVLSFSIKLCKTNL